VIGDLPNTNFVMNNVFLVGVYPGLTEPMLDFIADSIIKFVQTGESQSRFVAVKTSS
jgi:CDP-4-dehydro-6-deoxyglucose reductase, E1